jgi:hypothetical protein
VGWVSTITGRYYLVFESKKSVVFVYCCPDDAPRKSRMVYSTGKRSAIETCASILRMMPTVTLEISEADDICDEVSVVRLQCAAC